MEKVTHWNNVYGKKPGKKVGWYEEIPEVSLELLDLCALPPEAHVFIAGAGTTNLISFLLEKGFTKITANDISKHALDALAENLGCDSSTVAFVEDDLTRPSLLKNISPVDIWIDRAVLHFFLDEDDIQSYFDLLKEKVKPGGYAIIATFSKEGAKKCSGLPIRPYDAKDLKEGLGAQFKLMHQRDVIHTMPSGEARPYFYALFKRE